MSITTTTRPPPADRWRSHSPRTMPSNSRTPAGPASQPMQSRRSTKPRSPRVSPHPTQDLPASSPSYFGFVADPNLNPMDSNAGEHAKKNWGSTSVRARQPGGVSPYPYPIDAHPNFEAFRRQSQTSAFNLDHGNFSHFGFGPNADTSSVAEKAKHEVEGTAEPSSPLSSGSESKTVKGQDKMDIDMRSPSESISRDGSPSFFDMPRNRSPSGTPSPDLSKMQRDRAHHLAEGYRPNSLPTNPLNPPSPAPLQRGIQRAETLPLSLTNNGPNIVSPQKFVELIDSHLDVLLLDLRVFPQFSQSRISGAINLCIPTTLLKRPSFNVQKLAETFTKEAEKEKFSHWRDAQIIAVYDSSSTQLRDATSSVNTLKKFTSENWHGFSVVIRGGFSAFSTSFPDLIDRRTASEIEGSTSRKLALDPQGPAATSVAGGCAIPATKNAANPFFGNIRQNMDLIGGVGQLTVKLPTDTKPNTWAHLPTWLRRVTDEKDNGKTAADHFLGIEKAEQQRMQKALSVNVSYGPPDPGSAQSIQIAGLEKGAKNRYKDMLPFDHSRVRLQNVPAGSCDYVNASHIKSKWSDRHYVATQAPVPATFQDFWRLTWEQDARVIIMLTAESDGGQLKCHPYWLPGDYGSFKLKTLSERRFSLEPPNSAATDGFISPNNAAHPKRPSSDRRRSTNSSTISSKSFSTINPPVISPSPEAPYVIARKLALSNITQPFEPMREITQLQYSSWPDFGAPAHAAHVLGLIEYCGAVVRSYDATNGSKLRSSNRGKRPLIVHCSAGCGRTGTFCTIDSVLEMLKRQRLWKLKAENSSNKTYTTKDIGAHMDIDEGDEDEHTKNWISRDDVDLVAHTVEDFRLQRLSMVQTLRQFVLCYETVLEWIVREMPIE